MPPVTSPVAPLAGSSGWSLTRVEGLLVGSLVARHCGLAAIGVRWQLLTLRVLGQLYADLSHTLRWEYRRARLRTRLHPQPAPGAAALLGHGLRSRPSTEYPAPNAVVPHWALPGALRSQVTETHLALQAHLLELHGPDIRVTAERLRSCCPTVAFLVDTHGPRSRVGQIGELRARYRRLIGVRLHDLRAEHRESALAARRVALRRASTSSTAIPSEAIARYLQSERATNRWGSWAARVLYAALDRAYVAHVRAAHWALSCLRRYLANHWQGPVEPYAVAKYRYPLDPYEDDHPGPWLSWEERRKIHRDHICRDNALDLATSRALDSRCTFWVHRDFDQAQGGIYAVRLSRKLGSLNVASALHHCHVSGTNLPSAQLVRYARAAATRERIPCGCYLGPAPHGARC